MRFLIDTFLELFCEIGCFYCVHDCVVLCYLNKQTAQSCTSMPSATVDIQFVFFFNFFQFLKNILNTLYLFCFLYRRVKN